MREVRGPAAQPGEQVPFTERPINEDAARQQDQDRGRLHDRGHIKAQDFHRNCRENSTETLANPLLFRLPRHYFGNLTAHDTPRHSKMWIVSRVTLCTIWLPRKRFPTTR